MIIVVQTATNAMTNFCLPVAGFISGLIALDYLDNWYCHTGFIPDL